MSACTFITADCFLPEVTPSQDYPIHIDVDTGFISDGDADDNFSLRNLKDAAAYTDKPYAVELEWTYYTEGRGLKIIEYLREALQHAESLEIWHIWLLDYYEYCERPIIHKQTISINDLTPEDIEKLDDAEIWNDQNRIRPTFHCLTITR